MKLWLCPLALGVSLVFAVEAQSAPMALDACKRINDQIARYDSLRRRGGSITQMEAWKKSRALQQDKFHKGGCRKYGKALRKRE